MDQVKHDPAWLVDGLSEAARVVVLAHGAGLRMNSPFMNAFAQGLAKEDLRVVRFEFPYMRAWRETDVRRPPDPGPVLVETWQQVTAALNGETPLVIGGKSLGGRIASLIADDVGALGLVCLGYPFHPPGRPERRRVEHLLRLKTPTLIVQGTRDPFGRPDEVAGYGLPSTIELAWIEEGDHSYRPPARSGHTVEQNLTKAVNAVAAFVTTL